MQHHSDHCRRETKWCADFELSIFIDFTQQENNNAQPLKEEKKSEPAEESKSSVKAFAAAKYTECSNSTADESSNEDGDTASDLADTEVRAYLMWTHALSCLYLLFKASFKYVVFW